MRRFLLVFAALLSLLPATLFAREGMWLPPLLVQQAAALKSAGLRLPAEALYNTDGTGLNNAVVRFGSGCTGEMISGEGLLLTNHHCGYGTVQGLSSTAKDYFANGFWAMNKGEEIPCPGLTVTFVRKMDNVTTQVLEGVTDTMAEDQRDTLIARHIRFVEGLYKGNHPGMDAAVSSYYNGNEYWLSLTEVFKDVRLVGFPPNGIGQFGGDADNWMWPRHTGDFSLFRVYANAAGKPAEYNQNNLPYKSQKFFSINAKGVKEGDFTMVYGFPGTTQEYLAASQVAQIADIVDPIRIEARSARLAAWTKKMQADRAVFLKYTSKRAGVANGWKKWQGEVLGLKAADVVSRRRASEGAFQYWAQKDNTLPYADNVLSLIQANVATANEVLPAEMYFQEAVFGIEIIQRGAAMEKLLMLLQKGNEADLKKAGKDWEGFFKNYDAATDRVVFDTLMPLFFARVGKFVPDYFRKELARYNGSFKVWSEDLYRRSAAADRNRLEALLKMPYAIAALQLQNDPALLLYRAAQQTRKSEIAPVLATAQSRLQILSRLHRKAQRAAEPMRAWYPDANSNLRLAYGQVRGIDPDGPAPYSFQTFLGEAIKKDNPKVAEFQVPQKLKQLYYDYNFGRWNQGRDVPLAFIADNHTTGGNSGSPVLNADGELIGTNFDRIWEGTMSDLQFDPARCRNITLDVRYTLFIIEKFGGAGWLLKEMKIVK